MEERIRQMEALVTHCPTFKVRLKLGLWKLASNDLGLNHLVCAVAAICEQRSPLETAKRTLREISVLEPFVPENNHLLKIIWVKVIKFINLKLILSETILNVIWDKNI